MHGCFSHITVYRFVENIDKSSVDGGYVSKPDAQDLTYREHSVGRRRPAELPLLLPSGRTSKHGQTCLWSTVTQTITTGQRMFLKFLILFWDSNSWIVI